jgi:hypothetical protein
MVFMHQTTTNACEICSHLPPKRPQRRLGCPRTRGRPAPGRLVDEFLLQKNGHDGERQGGPEGHAHTVAFAPGRDAQASQQRAERHGDAVDQRMHADPHGPFCDREHARDKPHGGRQRNRGPGDEKDRSDDHRLPAREHDDDDETDHGDEVEHQQCALGADAVGEIAPGKGVERGEQVVQAAHQADGHGPAAQREKVDGKEPLGHPLAHPDQHHHSEHGDGAALQPEKVQDSEPQRDYGVR